MNWKYRKLKRRTVKKLREFREGNELSPLVLQATRQSFFIVAEELGVDRGKAADDFDIEIRGRVMR